MKQDREQILMSRLSAAKKLSLGEAMSLLNISESTARRMFNKLERDGFAIRIHGGIQCIHSTLTDYSFESGFQLHAGKKSAIAREAYHFLESGDVVFFDSGTTIQHLCLEVARQAREHELNLTVYTNSLANLELLAPHMIVHLVGGQYRENRKDFCGYLAEQTLSGLYFTKSFLSADGCAQGRRFTTTDFETARMNEITIRNSERTVMLLDSSKFSIFTHVAYAPVQDVYAIVTDTGIDADTLARLERSGAKIICVRDGSVPQQSGKAPSPALSSQQFGF